MRTNIKESIFQISKSHGRRLSSLSGWTLSYLKFMSTETLQIIRAKFKPSAHWVFYKEGTFQEEEGCQEMLGWLDKYSLGAEILKSILRRAHTLLTVHSGSLGEILLTWDEMLTALELHIIPHVISPVDVLSGSSERTRKIHNLKILHCLSILPSLVLSSFLKILSSNPLIICMVKTEVPLPLCLAMEVGAG